MIAQRCGPPVLCALSGEDIFLEKLRPPYYQQSRQLLRERAAHVDAFTVLNTYYADYMANYLSVDRQRVHVIPHGLQLEGHGERQERGDCGPLRVGYLARICEDKGLHLLVEACELLIDAHQAPRIELHAAGYLGAGDRDYLSRVQTRADQGSLAGNFHYHGELDRAKKIEFLQSLAVFSTPTVYPESKGLPLLEAWANAVPAVVPQHGTFPELIADTQGGLLCQPDEPRDLAAKLAELLQDRKRATKLGLAGQQAVRERYHAQLMAARTCAVYRNVMESAS